MAERNVTFLIIAKDLASRTLRDVGDSSDHAAQKLRDLNTMGLGPLATTAAALGPALLPVLAGVTAGAVGLGTSLVGAGAAVGVFGAVAKSVFGEVLEASKKSDALREKIHLLTTEINVANSMGDAKNAKKFLDARTKATIEYVARLQQLPAPMRAAVLGMDRMRNAWEDFVTANRTPVLNLLARGMNLLAAVLPKLQPLFNVAASAAGRLMSAMEGLVASGSFDDLVSWLTARAGPAFQHFGSIVVNLGIGVAALLSPFAKTADGVVAGLDSMSKGFEHWAATSGQAGSARLLQFAKDQGPAAARALQEIAVSFVSIAKATGPLAPVSIAIAKSLAQIINALPQPVLTSLVAAFISWNVALQGVRAATIGLSVVASLAGIVTGLTAAITGSTLATDANTAAKVAYAVATGIATVATGAWAAALWLADAALAVLLSPIFLIVAGVAALVVGVILAYQHITVFRNAVNAVGHAIAAAAVWLGGAFMSAIRAIPGLLSSLVGFFAALPMRILHGLIQLPILYLKFWRFVLESAFYLIAFEVGLVVNFFMHLPGWIMSAVHAIPGLLSALWNAVWSRAKAVTKAGADAVVGFFKALPGRAWGAAKSLWSAVSGAFVAAYNGARSWTKRATDATVGFLAALPGRAGRALAALPGAVKGALAGAGSWLLEAGKDVVRGLINGITSMAGAVVDEAKRIGSRIVSGFRDAMHIGSPSRVMADQVGRWIPAGIAAGITEGMPVLAGAASAVRTKLLGALDPRTRIRWGEVSAAKWDQLLAAGWRGNPNDKMEALYAPTSSPEILQPIQLVVDGKVLQEVLLKVKRTNRGLALGLA